MQANNLTLQISFKPITPDILKYKSILLAYLTVIGFNMELDHLA
ncbi:hypothetical protein GARC_0743 [Paraglaciecola arctica BSs20135]|uniref:Uncharacterized protein n=1 Tax=Paraglaciecola arctica BSs20135 TaxID=493475 RepID=K6XAS2_9ALTE|nr:hypothetical protein GARC_0743 [Paraglaciecola arctica BSs20135]